MKIKHISLFLLLFAGAKPCFISAMDTTQQDPVLWYNTLFNPVENQEQEIYRLYLEKFGASRLEEISAPNQLPTHGIDGSVLSDLSELPQTPEIPSFFTSTGTGEFPYFMCTSCSTAYIKKSLLSEHKKKCLAKQSKETN